MEKDSILIVDDNTKNIQVLANLLADNNFEIEYCLNGKTAIDYISKRNFDLILLDIMMPEMDGYETCEKIKKIPDRAGIPIIFITAKTDIESLTRAFNVGGIDYITKPFNERELLARVNTQLELKKHKDKLEELVEIRTLELNKAYKALESLDVAKGEFLQIISHEIRTPLNGIKGILDVLKLEIEDEELLGYFAYLDESTYRLEKFSLQALLITELRTDKRNPNPENIFINKLITGLIESDFQNQLVEKRIKTEYKLESDNIRINADIELVINCVSNVIENAIYYCKSGGAITIGGYKEDSTVNIEISDEGPGFSDKALENLFKVFEPGEKHVNENMGIDLALANLIMKAHKGSIEVRNNKPEGATVKLSFPEGDL